MSQAYVQTHTGGHAQSGLNPTCSVVSATVGNHLRLNIRYSSNGRSVASISDGHNTWNNASLKATDGGTNNGQELWYAENCAAGSYTVTLTMDSSSATNIEVFIDEFSGAVTSGSVDVGSENGATTGASPLALGPTAGTATANENVYTVAMVVNGANARPLTNPPSGYTADFNGQVNGNATQFCSAHKNITSTGQQSASWAWTGGSMNSTGIIITFKDAAGGAVTGTASVALKPGIPASGNALSGTGSVALKPGLTVSGTVTNPATGSLPLPLKIVGQAFAGQAGAVALKPTITAMGTWTPAPPSGPGPTQGGGYPSTKIWPFTQHRTGPKVVTHFEEGRAVQPSAPVPPTPPAVGGGPKRPVRRRRTDLSPTRTPLVLPPLEPIIPQPLAGLLKELPPVQVPKAPKPPERPAPPPPPKPKKLVLVTRYWGGLGLAMLAQRQGSDLIVATDYRTVPAKERKATEQIGHGLVPRLSLPEVETLVRGDDVLWVFDSNDLPKEADRLRARGESVIGTSALSAQLEEDRDFAAQFAQSVGFDLPETEEFHDYDAAIQYLESHGDQSFVYKPDAQDPTATYVPLEKEDAAKANQELQEYLKSLHESAPSFILQEVVNGTEANFEAWVSNGVPLVGFCDLESKRKLVGDLGENLGCAGDYVFALGLDSPALAETVLRYLGDPRLRGYTGSVDANVMLKDGKVYFLENCFRFGYNAYGTIFQALATGRMEDTLRAWVNGDDLSGAFKPGFGASLTLVCDHPKAGVPILIPPELENQVYQYRTWCDGDHCAMVEEWPEVCAVTAYGDTMQEAGDACLDAAKDVAFPGKGYRIDLASEDLETLPIPRYKALQEMGWVAKPEGQEEVEHMLKLLEMV